MIRFSMLANVAVLAGSLCVAATAGAEEKIRYLDLDSAANRKLLDNLGSGAEGNSLSQLPNLKIKSRDSVFRYKGKDTDAQAVGRELGVRAIFKGRLIQQGDSLTISAELIDAQTDDHIWGQQYNRKITDIFALQEEVPQK